MKMPKMRAHLSNRLRFLGYLDARLVRARYVDLTPALRASRAEMKAVAADLQLLEETLQETIAIRDAYADDLDDLARDLRASLAGRSRDAHRQSPYVDLFPRGIRTYVDASLGQRSARFRELASRIEEALAESDPVRADAATMRALLAAWQQAADAVADAREALARGRTRRDKATRVFLDAVTAVYAALLVRVGKSQAERFFPKTSGARRVPAPADRPLGGAAALEHSVGSDGAGEDADEDEDEDEDGFDPLGV